METYEDLYKTICRVCLSYGKNENMVCLTEQNSENGLSSYGLAVKAFANININAMDDLPKLMCQNCLKILKHAIYFKLKCEASDKHLSRLIKLHKNTGSNLQENVVDFLMFTNCFPQESSTESSNSTSKSNPKHLNMEMNERLSIDCDNVSLESEIVKSTTDYDFAEKELQKLEKMFAQPSFTMLKSINNSEMDEEMTNLESMVSSPSRVALKNKYKTSRQQKYVRLKDLHEKRNLVQLNKFQRHFNMTRRNPRKPKKSLEELICKICQKVLANQQTYRYHMQRHNGCEFICEHCGKGFPLLCELNMHLVVRHDTGPHLKCPHCPYKAPKKVTLIEHIRIHTGERPYTCDKCGLTFRRRAIWKKHLLVHAEKTVQCPQCPKKFFVRGQMLSHANSIHERTYVYLCHKCDVTYAKTATVRRHLTERHGIPRELQGKIMRINKGEVLGIL